ncbi:MAG: leucyl aminopeptidase [Nostocoides sp.]
MTDQPTDSATDVLVLGTTRRPGGDSPEVVAAGQLPAPVADYLAAAAATLGATGAADEVVRLVAVPGVAAASVVLTGLGSSGDGVGTGPGDGTGSLTGAEALRRAAGAALRAVAGQASTVAISLPVSTIAALRAVGEGAYAGCYRYEGRARGGVTEVVIDARGVQSGSTGVDPQRALTAAEVVGRQRTLAMDLTNTPPNLLTPVTFADRVTELAAQTAGSASVEVMTEADLAAAGCGGILGVGQGSAVPPRIVRLSYTPSRALRHVALVGKGITFDTGGLRLKPIEGMLHMKTDMEGAAVVAGAFFGAVELALPVAVTAYLCLAENMVDGNSQRPSDVVTLHNGMSVEILDPDAEGRMVLADGLALACELRPDVVLDIATLTGMQSIGLGQRVAGLMGNDEAFRAQVFDSALAAGEAMWQIPLVEDYRASLETPMADIAHKATPQGGMITAGLFLREFVTGGIPWAHIDMAGPGRSDHAYGHTPKGATGFGVGTLLRLLESLGHSVPTPDVAE